MSFTPSLSALGMAQLPSAQDQSDVGMMGCWRRYVDPGPTTPRPQRPTSTITPPPEKTGAERDPTPQSQRAQSNPCDEASVFSMPHNLSVRDNGDFGFMVMWHSGDDADVISHRVYGKWRVEKRMVHSSAVILEGPPRSLAAGKMVPQRYLILHIDVERSSTVEEMTRLTNIDMVERPTPNSTTLEEDVRKMDFISSAANAAALHLGLTEEEGSAVQRHFENYHTNYSSLLALAMKLAFEANAANNDHDQLRDIVLFALPEKSATRPPD